MLFIKLHQGILSCDSLKIWLPRKTLDKTFTDVVVLAWYCLWTRSVRATFPRSHAKVFAIEPTRMRILIRSILYVPLWYKLKPRRGHLRSRNVSSICIREEYTLTICFAAAWSSENEVASSHGSRARLEFTKLVRDWALSPSVRKVVPFRERKNN